MGDADEYVHGAYLRTPTSEPCNTYAQYVPICAPWFVGLAVVLARRSVL
jgi:hypothetical protein